MAAAKRMTGVVIVALALGACGSSQDDAARPVDQPQPQKTYQPPKPQAGMKWVPAPKPVLISAPPLTVPAVAQNQGISGWVKIAFRIDERGVPVNLRVVGADPRGIFEQNALAYVAGMRYRPAIKDGLPTAQPHVALTVRFQPQR